MNSSQSILSIATEHTGALDKAGKTMYGLRETAVTRVPEEAWSNGSLQRVPSWTKSTWDKDYIEFITKKRPHCIMNKDRSPDQLSGETRVMVCCSYIREVSCVKVEDLDFWNER